MQKFVKTERDECDREVTDITNDFRLSYKHPGFDCLNRTSQANFVLLF